MILSDLPAAAPVLARIVAAVLDRWPEHRGYLDRRFRDETPEGLASAETLAGLVAAIAGDDLGRVIDGYRHMCGMINDEEIHFRRTGRYRLSSFAEVEAAIYADPACMAPYLDGILLSQLLWRNHADAIGLYRRRFLGGNRPGYRHLEIGPGHGLLLALALADPACAAAAGWDVSATSLGRTADALARLGIGRVADLRAVDVADGHALSGARFDSLVASEVLEHLERPDLALETFRRLAAPGARLFLNVPVNSPAPDHIFLFETPEAVLDMTRAAGFDIEHTAFLPSTGLTLDRARKIAATISAVIIARAPG